jgi:hypothetical protein
LGQNLPVTDPQPTSLLFRFRLSRNGIIKASQFLLVFLSFLNSSQKINSIGKQSEKKEKKSNRTIDPALANPQLPSSYYIVFSTFIQIGKEWNIPIIKARAERKGKKVSRFHCGKKRGSPIPT